MSILTTQFAQQGVHFSHPDPRSFELTQGTGVEQNGDCYAMQLLSFLMT